MAARNSSNSERTAEILDMRDGRTFDGSNANEDENMIDLISASAVKPRIILTIRPSEADPDAYFSTSSLKSDLTENDFEENDDNVAHCTNSQSRRKDGHPLISSSSSTHAVAAQHSFNTRVLRKMPNTKETVLQNAIALKEKSLRIASSDRDSGRKSKSPKNSGGENRTAKTPRPKSSSSKTLNSTSILQPMVMTENYTIERTVTPDNNHDYFTDDVVPLDNGGAAVTAANGTSIVDNAQSWHKRTRRRKRYYKGLSYNFHNKKNAKKRRRLSAERNQTSKSATAFGNDENDTDSQNTVILPESSETKSGEEPNDSSSDTVLETMEDSGLRNGKPTSLDVINRTFSEKTLSPSTGDASQSAARPESTLISSGGGTAALCLCQVQEQVYAKSDSSIKYYCQAIDSIDEKRIGCCNYANEVDEEICLQRPSVKVPYQMFCEAHNYRLLIHDCCPTCGLFCTQGNIVLCESHHAYHRKCEMIIENKRVCPHCGQPSPPYDARIVIGDNITPVFVPLQRTWRDIPSAKMTFPRIKRDKNEDNKPSSPPVPSPTLACPSGVEVTNRGLPDIKCKEIMEKYASGSIPTENHGLNQRYTYRTIYHAAKSGDAEKLLTCICAGLNPNHLYRELTMGTALHAACSNGFISVVHILIQAGVQLDTLDKEHNTALILATQNGHNDIVKYLIKAGASITLKGKDGMTALHVAAKAGNLQACFYLMTSLRLQRDYVNIMDDGGWTALVWAAEFNHLDVLLYLLSQEADPFIRDVEYNIALHWSAFTGSVDTTEALLRYDSDINCTNVHGDTPLHVAARQNHYSCVLLLLSRGARTDIKNNKGTLAADCCIDIPCDSYHAIKLSMELKKKTTSSREKTTAILTNDITKGYEMNPIQCVNNLDDEKEPTDFVYVTENCFTSNIRQDRRITSLKHCSCIDYCSTSSCICGGLSLQCWYTDDAKLSIDFNYTEPPMIFECNSVCKCNKVTCKNRVVQHGITGRFQLFRTNDKGWGVITLSFIPKGTYVCEYIGEIISDTEADIRQEDSYLFDLENKDGETFCIDAFHYGNIARFINHSCVPNLLPVKVFIDHHDLRFPRIAFFSNRDIEANEELGFDYGEKFWIIKYKTFTCTCGAETCRYSETTIRKTLDAYNKRLQVDEMAT